MTIALLVLALIGQPLLSLLGEVHAAAHGDVAVHVSHSEHATNANPGDSPGSGDLLHDILHLTACCVHLTALPGSLAATDSVPATMHLPSSAEHHAEDIFPSRRLRPPIIG
ncbi:hypothetical protein [Wenzhouxiangella marina]|uniref:hypothetical protein n=1 Tax=Wenzhouxiangella marina TaxID=1579979 RepID=UPI0012E18C73|nr:hypothetical protein [Wenzhouxiangella marina]MBB6085682.1 hypothetical protein [Wenzhouxiangella marina]